LLLPKTFSKLFGVYHFQGKITQKLKTFKIVANLLRSGCPSKFTATSNCAMPRETAKKTKATSQTLQASVSMLINMACLEGFAGESLFSLNRTWLHSLGLQSYI